MDPVDELLAEHAEKLQEVYDNQTAGDYTFLGALANFLRDYQRITS